MGTYIYRTSPNATVQVEVLFKDGTRSVQTVSLFSYLGKPGWHDDDPYTVQCNRLAALCEGQFRKAGPAKQPRELGVLTYEKQFTWGQGGSPVYATCGMATVYDDTLMQVGVVARVLGKLPRGYTVVNEPAQLLRRVDSGAVVERNLAFAGRGFHRYQLFKNGNVYVMACDDGRDETVLARPTADALYSAWHEYCNH